MIWLLCGSYIRKVPYQLAVAAIKKQATALSGTFFPCSSENDWLLAELLPVVRESPVLVASLSFFKTYHYNLLDDQT